MSRRMRWIVPGGALAAALAAAVFLFMRHPLEIAAWLQRRELQGKGFDAVELGPADERLTLFAGGSGPPLVFLHGVGDHAGGWSKVAPAFRDRFRVFVPDLPGHGESEPAAGELPMATVVAGAERVLAVAAQDGPAVVVGNSMGAWVSTLLAERHPRQVSRLVLVGGGALLGETGGPSLQPRDRAAAAELMAHVRDPSSPPLPGFVLDALVRRAEAGPFARVSADATNQAHLPWAGATAAPSRA